jgi:hypothetical protein
VLSQRFQDSPHLFARELGKDLREHQIKEGDLLQYVDDLLICNPTQDISNAITIWVLNFLADRGYKISKNKAQISLQEVHYLGYILAPGAWRLSTERIEATCIVGIPLGEDWQVNFTHTPSCQGYKQLLVFIDTFTGWIEAFPT